MEFYMVYHYSYDGCANYDMSYVKPCSTSELGMEWLTEFYKDNQEYNWETDGQGFKIVKRLEGRYGFDYYGLEKMVMDEEID